MLRVERHDDLERLHRFHNTGVAWVRGALADSGRYTVTRRDTHLGAFKTPTLREITHTAPYMRALSGKVSEGWP